MSLYDLTLPIRPGMLAWPGAASPEQVWETRLDRGEESNSSAWRIRSHSGTHVDAPAHFFNDGAMLGDLPLDLFVGPCTVVQVADEVEQIDHAVVSSLGLPRPRPSGGTIDLSRILFKTSNSTRRLHRGVFDPTFVAFTPDGAEALLDLGVRLLGIDYLSVDLFSNGYYPAHRLLLGAGVVVLECVDLRDVSPGRYRLACLPLRTQASEAAPVRAVLWTD